MISSISIAENGRCSARFECDLFLRVHVMFVSNGVCNILLHEKNTSCNWWTNSSCSHILKIFQWCLLFYQKFRSMAEILRWSGVNRGKSPGPSVEGGSQWGAFLNWTNQSAACLAWPRGGQWGAPNHRRALFENAFGVVLSFPRVRLGQLNAMAAIRL